MLSTTMRGATEVIRGAALPGDIQTWLLDTFTIDANGNLLPYANAVMRALADNSSLTAAAAQRLLDTAPEKVDAVKCMAFGVKSAEVDAAVVAHASKSLHKHWQTLVRILDEAAFVDLLLENVEQASGALFGVLVNGDYLSFEQARRVIGLVPAGQRRDWIATWAHRLTADELLKLITDNGNLVPLAKSTVQSILSAQPDLWADMSASDPGNLHREVYAAAARLACGDDPLDSDVTALRSILDDLRGDVEEQVLAALRVALHPALHATADVDGLPCGLSDQLFEELQEYLLGMNLMSALNARTGRGDTDENADCRWQSQLDTRVAEICGHDQDAWSLVIELVGLGSSLDEAVSVAEATLTTEAA